MVGSTKEGDEVLKELLVEVRAVGHTVLALEGMAAEHAVTLSFYPPLGFLRSMVEMTVASLERATAIN
jgi:hypothetical protein